MGKRVLIVDDAPFMRAILGEILRKAGCEVVGEAENASDAVEQYKKLRPDFVTMDIIMPKENGIEAVKKILEFDSNAKIVICTSLSYKKILAEAIGAGARDYILKPFREENVLEVLGRIMK